MSGRRFFTGAVVVAALGIIAALCGMQRAAQRRLFAQADESRHLLTQLNDLEVENFRLSNSVAQANAPISEEQLAELDKLRDEVQSLRRRTNDIVTLQGELRRVRAELSRTRDMMASNGPPDVPAEDIYPRDSWTFAGFDTPEDAVESATWAISEGDQDTYLAALAPELREEMQAELGDGSFGEAGPMEMSDATGYRIVDRDTVSDNERIITVYMDGDRNIVSLTLTNTGDGWRVSGENGE
ncbi:MAG TPA: hypothetical protein VG938_07105 [Verrucomicrobiae bacterium]|jgi:hypothetical protein|nr:hypothetical protein [Verrucomicrobiae bacterium]